MKKMIDNIEYSSFPPKYRMEAGGASVAVWKGDNNLFSFEIASIDGSHCVPLIEGSKIKTLEEAGKAAHRVLREVLGIRLHKEKELIGY